LSMFKPRVNSLVTEPPPLKSGSGPNSSRPLPVKSFLYIFFTPPVNLGPVLSSDRRFSSSLGDPPPPPPPLVFGFFSLPCKGLLTSLWSASCLMKARCFFFRRDSFPQVEVPPFQLWVGRTTLFSSIFWGWASASLCAAGRENLPYESRRVGGTSL